MSIVWSVLPANLLKPRWYDFERVRKIPSYSCAAIAGGCCGLASTKFISIRAGLFGLVTSLFFTYVLGKIPPSLRDPTVASRERKKAGEDWVRAPAFWMLYQNHRPLLEQQLITSSEMNDLLESDIKALGYDAFMTIHAPRGCIDVLLGWLNPAHLAILKSKYLGQADQRNEPFTRGILEISDVEWRIARINRAARLATDWNAFVQEYGYSAATEVTDLESERVLRDLFLAQVYQESEPGPLTIPFRKEAKQFIEVERAVFFIQQSYQDRYKSNQLLERYGWEFRFLFDKIDPARLPDIKRMLRQVYLHCVTYDEWVDRFEDLRKTLEMTDEMIADHLCSLCDQTDYLGRRGFHVMHGSRPLKDGILKEKQLEKIRAEIREKGISMHDLERLYPDVKALGIGKEVFEQCWKNRSLQSIWLGGNKNLFLKGIQDGLLNSQEWIEKGIEETEDLTVFQILIVFPGLMGTILHGSDKRGGGKTFAESAEESLSRIPKLYTTVGDDGWRSTSLQTCLPALIELKLIDPQNPNLRQLLKNHILHNREEIFLRDQGYREYYPAYDGWQQVLKWTYWPSLRETHERALQVTQQALKESLTASVEIEEEYKKKFQEDSDRITVAQKTYAENKKKRLEEVASVMRDLERTVKELPNLQEKELELYQQKRKVVELQGKILGIQRRKALIEARSLLNDQLSGLESTELQYRRELESINTSALEAEIKSAERKKETLENKFDVQRRLQQEIESATMKSLGNLDAMKREKESRLEVVKKRFDETLMRQAQEIGKVFD